MNRKIQILCIITVGLMLVISCSTQKIIPDSKTTVDIRNAFMGEYNVTERFDVLAGGLTGRKGESKYVITLVPADKENNILIENFANSFKVAAVVDGAALTIPPQRFPHLNSQVMIKGNGRVKKDTIRYEYFSGGPAGQFECKCIAVKKNSK